MPLCSHPARAIGALALLVHLIAAAHAAAAVDVRYLETERLRLGVDTSLGGAVTFLEDRKAGGGNMINSHDWGRQIQMSYYSGPVPYIGPKGEQPHEHWARLGWNPIQSGSVGGVKSRLLSVEQPDARNLVVRCTPMQWPHLDVPGDCIFEAGYRLVEENVVEMSARIINQRADKTPYGARRQEMPALYTNGPWYRLVAVQGEAGAEVATLVGRDDGKGWPWLTFYAPEQWAALVNDAGRGVGLYQPATARINGGFHGGDARKGHGGERDAQTGHISPVADMILDAGIDWTYRAWIIVGSVEEIRAFAVKKHRELRRLDWRFETDRAGWFYRGSAEDSGWPVRDELKIRFAATPRGDVVSPELFWRAEEAPEVAVEAAFEKQAGVATLTAEIIVHPVGPKDGWVEAAWGGEASPPPPALHVPLTVQADGGMRVYRARLQGLPAYDGPMRRLMLRLPASDGRVRLKSIALRRG
jgi:hypothetical protein